MNCPICREPYPVGSGSNRQDAQRRALAKHLERVFHPLGVLADLAARQLLKVSS